MLQDKFLLLRCKNGSAEALSRIYLKYKDYLLTVANALLNDRAASEDILHDCFISFAKSIDNFHLRGSLKNYLARCVANRARDRIRFNKRERRNLNSFEPEIADEINPEKETIEKEASARLRSAMRLLPYDQREVFVLHVQGEMKFREIAELQNVSIKAVQSRYRYGIEKLQALLEKDNTK